MGAVTSGAEGYACPMELEPAVDSAVFAADVSSGGMAAPGATGAHPQLWAVNLISDPIHGYIELTKRLTPERAHQLGLAQEDAAEADLLDSAWLQRMRRISQLQSARWVFPTAEHSRFTHGLGVMHEAGPVGAPPVPEPAGQARRGTSRARRRRPRAWSSKRYGWPDCSTTSAMGLSPTSSTSTSCATSRRRTTLAAASGRA